MSKPWMKFYPADWQADPALRSCSLSARGLWVELLAVMQKSERVGYLLVNGKAPTERALAVLCGATPREVSKGLLELEDAGVFSRDDAGVIFSRRMVRDEERAARDKANGGKGGNPRLKPGVNPDDKGGDKAQKLEARYSDTNVSGAAAPIDADQKAWREAVSVLTAGDRMTEPKARSLFGRLLSENGIAAKAMLPALAKCIEIGTQDPAAYLRKAAQGVSDRRSGGTPAPLPAQPEGGEINWPLWAAAWKRDRTWPVSILGPTPNEPGCKCPAELLGD